MTRGVGPGRAIPLQIALAFLLLSASNFYSTAYASTGPGGTYCAHGGNSGDTACVNSKNNEKYIAAETQWSDNNIDVYNVDGTQFINNDMWVYTSPDESSYLEVGAGYGTCLGKSGTRTINVCPGSPQSFQAYRFWADTGVQNGQYVQYLHWNSWWTRNTGNLHTYDILREKTDNGGNICYWDIEIDSQYAGTSHLQYCPGGYSYAYEDQVGIEFNGSGNAYWPYSNTNVFEGNATYHDGAWHPWEYQRQWIDQPCGGNNGTTDCFNGTNYNDVTRWFANRPRG